jgi:membrane protease YdiL (CAAX protease family)
LSTELVATERKEERPRGLKVFLFFVLHIILYSIIMTVFLVIGPVYDRSHIVTSNGALAMFLALIVLVSVVRVFPSIWNYSKAELFLIPKKRWKLFAGFVVGIGLPVFYQVVLNQNFSPIESLQLMLAGRTYQGYGWTESILDIVTLGILIPIMEEFVFRGILQRFLTERYHFAVGIICASLLFGTMHLNPILGIVLGFSFGFAYRISGSLLLAIFVHAAWNLFFS